MTRFRMTLPAALLAAGLALLPAGVAAGWSWTSSKLPEGGEEVRATTVQNRVAVSIACLPGTGPTVFQVEIAGAQLPYLAYIANTQESLIFRFGEGGGQAGRFDGWADVWYSAGDRVWRGGLYLEPEALDAFGGASVMRILNSFGQEVARFDMVGSRLSEQAMRAICHRGMTTQQWVSELTSQTR